MAILSTNEMLYTAFEPKLKNRFVKFIDGIPAFLIRQANKPNITFSDVILDHINVKRKIKGKANWEDVQVTLYDPITPSGAQACMEWARLSYESVTGRAGYSDFYKKDITLNVLGPVGDIVSEWIIKGAMITSFAQGSFDWTSSEPAEVTLTVAMDYCVLNY